MYAIFGFIEREDVKGLKTFIDDNGKESLMTTHHLIHPERVTPIEFSIMGGYSLEIIQMLIEHMKMFNLYHLLDCLQKWLSKDHYLYMYAKLGDHETVKCFIDIGVDPGYAYKAALDNKDLEMFKILSSFIIDNITSGIVLQEASVIDGNDGIIRYLVSELDTDVDFTGDSNTPLFLASSSGCHKNIKTLVSLKADLEYRNCKGLSPLFMAASKGCMISARILVESGANLDSISFCWLERDDPTPYADVADEILFSYPSKMTNFFLRLRSLNKFRMKN